MSTEPFDPSEPAGVFTSRWWGIMSTVYLILGPLSILAGVVGFIGAAFGGNKNGPLLYRPEVFLLVYVLAPLFVGFVVATAIESRRTAEPPLPRSPLVRRAIRIGVGLFAPAIMVILLIVSVFNR